MRFIFHGSVASLSTNMERNGASPHMSISSSGASSAFAPGSSPASMRAWWRSTCTSPPESRRRFFRSCRATWARQSSPSSEMKSSSEAVETRLCFASRARLVDAAEAAVPLDAPRAPLVAFELAACRSASVAFATFAAIVSFAAAERYCRRRGFGAGGSAGGGRQPSHYRLVYAIL